MVCYQRSKIPPEKWLVVLEKDLYKKTTIGTIFNETNEYIKNRLKLTKPIDFDYDDVEDEHDDELDLVTNEDNEEEVDETDTESDED